MHSWIWESEPVQTFDEPSQIKRYDSSGRIGWMTIPPRFDQNALKKFFGFALAFWFLVAGLFSGAWFPFSVWIVFVFLRISEHFALSLAFCFCGLWEVALYYDLNFRLSFNSRNSVEPHLHFPFILPFGFFAFCTHCPSVLLLAVFVAFAAAAGKKRRCRLDLWLGSWGVKIAHTGKKFNFTLLY